MGKTARTQDTQQEGRGLGFEGARTLLEQVRARLCGPR
jgi:hypothetical protein